MTCDRHLVTEWNLDFSLINVIGRNVPGVDDGDRQTDKGHWEWIRYLQKANRRKRRMRWFEGH